MARHDVKFSVPSRPLAYKDIEFAVRRNGAKLGELRISQGGVLWVPRDHKFGYHVRWDQIAELIEDNGRKKRS